MSGRKKNPKAPNAKDIPTSENPSSSNKKAVISLATDQESLLAYYRENVPEWDRLSEPQKESAIRALAARRSKFSRVNMEYNGKALQPGKGFESEVPFNMALFEAFGTSSPSFMADGANRLLNYAMAVENDSLAGANIRMNAMLAMIHGSEPRNEVEAALLSQMAATHSSAMVAITRMERSKMVDHVSLYANLAVKLQRTFVMQAEALAKLRRGGEQVVRHIHLDNRGGQAVIAENVTRGGPNAETLEQPYEPDPQTAGRAALLGQDAPRNLVPVSGDQRPNPMPIARRSRRRPGGERECS